MSTSTHSISKARNFSRNSSLASFWIWSRFVEQAEHGLGMGNVAKEGAQHRIDGLRYQFLDVAKSLDDTRSAFVVDVNDDAQGQKRFISVFGNQVDGAKTFIVFVRFRPTGYPVKNKISRWDSDDAACIAIESVLARPESFLPKPLFLQEQLVRRGGSPHRKTSSPHRPT